jgi:hypothetical protein
MMKNQQANKNLSDEVLYEFVMDEMERSEKLLYE